MDRREQFGVLVRGIGVFEFSQGIVSLPMVVVAVSDPLAILWTMTFPVGSLAVGAVLFFAADRIVNLAYRVRGNGTFPET